MSPGPLDSPKPCLPRDAGPGRVATPRAPWFVAVALVALLGACSGRADDHVALRSGDTLFDHLDAVFVDAHPSTNLPDDVAADLGEILARPNRAIAPDAWAVQRMSRLKPAQRADVDLMALMFHDTLGAAGDLSCWRVRPEVRLDAGLGRVRLRHGGREVPGVERDAASPRGGATVWFDESAPLVLWWDAPGGELLAFGPRPPEALEVVFEVDDGSVLARAERRLVTRDEAPSDATWLASAWTLGTVTRPCLVAPAPTTLRASLGSLPGRRLQVAVGVADVGAALRDTGPGDGVTFSIEVEQAGATRTVWSRHVLRDEGFVEAEVELSDAAPGPLVLRLLTDAGPAGDGRYDHGLWSGLVFMGDAAQAPRRPHVVLVVVDTLRADRMGCYGYPRNTTPRLDAWAAREAERFSDSMAVADWTLPSTVSLMSGLSVPQHGVRDGSRRLGDTVPLLAERLRALGYETLARTDGGYVSAAYGFARGFDRFEAHQRPWREHHDRGWRDELARLAARDSERPVFQFLQTYQVHTPLGNDHRFDDPDDPYEGPWSERQISQTALAEHVASGGSPPAERDRRWVSDQYDAAVRRMDDVVGELLEGLPAVFGDEPYMVLLTSDHGEELFDRGAFGHRHSLHTELTDVPLILRHPDLARVGSNDTPASGIDVAPTILDAVGAWPAAGLTGASLLDPPPRTRPRTSSHGQRGYAYVMDGWKLLTGMDPPGEDGAPSTRLYRLPDDPDERRDVADQYPDRAARLADALTAQLERHTSDEASLASAPLDDALRAQLEALGYLGDG